LTATRGLHSMLAYPALHEYNKPRPHYSQFGQDALVGDILFRTRNGIFVDVGARDGIVASNTYYLEREFGWTGVAIEPHPEFFQQLVAKRSCRCVNVAAGRAPATLDYVKLLEGSIDHSALLSTFRDQAGLRQMKHEIISVPVEPLSSIISDLPVVHYLDIDVEGHELEVLQGIDFTRIQIRIIGVEVGANREAIDNFLAEHDFKPFMTLHADRFYSYRDIPTAGQLLELP
jgi:FkbM family methyltransferase